MLKKAHAAGANFVISHESIWYRHSLHGTKDIEGDKVIEEKKAFIKEHNMVVWRQHDHWHAREPDGILEGMVDELGWRDNHREGDPNCFDLPEGTLRELAEQLERILGTTAIRVIGDPELKCSKIAFLPGATPSIMQIRLLQRDDVEVLISGELREWETVEYARDAAESGRRKAFILLGHAVSGEAGMKAFARWLAPHSPLIKITFIPAGDPFWSL